MNILRWTVLLACFLSKAIVESGNDHQKRQLQIINLFSRLSCDPRSDQKKFDANKPSRKPRWDGFHLNPQSVIQATTDVFQTLYFMNASTSEEWDQFYATALSLSRNQDPISFAWGFKTILDTKFYGEYKSPPFYEVWPQLYVPRKDLLALNGINRPVDTPTTPSAEDGLAYFRDDVTLNDFHTAWHLHYPPWWEDAKYNLTKDRKGEMFLYAHHQIINRFVAERVSNKLDKLEPLNLTGPVIIREGHVPTVIQEDYSDFPKRLPNSKMDDAIGNYLLRLETRILDAIQNGSFVNFTGGAIPIRGNVNASDILGSLAEASRDSINPAFYGNLHNNLHRSLGDITENMKMGVMSFPEVAMHDPIFYNLHLLIDNIYRRQKEAMDPYTWNELGFSGVDISSIRISSSAPSNSTSSFQNWWNNVFPRPGGETFTLTTYFENYTIDVSNGIQDCSKLESGQNFTLTLPRLTHYPFEYSITSWVWTSRRVKAFLRIFMSPTEDSQGVPFSAEELNWNMIEMDKFPILLRPGRNTIKRSSKNSSVTIGDQLGFKELIREAEKMTEDKNSTDSPPFQPCGLPNHLLLPKGTKEGMKYRMFVMLSPAKDEEFYDEGKYPSISLCGVGTGVYPDGKAFGFPFDKKSPLPRSRYPFVQRENFRFVDILVKHVDKAE